MSQLISVGPLGVGMGHVGHVEMGFGCVEVLAGVEPAKHVPPDV